jgi:hypothetical protein
MNETSLEIKSAEQLASIVLRQRASGDIDAAMRGFATEFRFRDEGLGLQFTDKLRLARFFRRTRLMYPNESPQTERVIASGKFVTLEWSLMPTITEAFYGGLSQTLPTAICGASIILTESGKISQWTDYYDGLRSRRAVLASYFTEWIEL